MQEAAKPEELTGAAIRAATWIALGLTATAVLVAPAVTAFAHLSSQLPALWLAASLAPAALVTACQGLLQGGERFTALAVLSVVLPFGRLVGAAALVMLGYGVAGALAGVGIGSAVAAGIGVVMIDPRLIRRSVLPNGFWREFAQAALAILGLFVLANVDVLLARHYLPPVESGLYAVGSVVAKVAFWAPQFVVVLAFPRLADPASARRVLRRAALVVVGIGAAVTGASLVMARSAVTFFIGPDYANLAEHAWVFAAIGSVLALIQLMLFSGIASDDSRMSALVVVVTIAMVITIATIAHAGLWQLAATVLAFVSGLAALAVVLQKPRGKMP